MPLIGTNNLQYWVPCKVFGVQNFGFDIPHCQIYRDCVHQTLRIVEIKSSRNGTTFTYFQCLNFVFKFLRACFCMPHVGASECTKGLSALSDTKMCFSNVAGIVCIGCKFSLAKLSQCALHWLYICISEIVSMCFASFKVQYGHH